MQSSAKMFFEKNKDKIDINKLILINIALIESKIDNGGHFRVDLNLGRDPKKDNILILYLRLLGYGVNFEEGIWSITQG